MIIDAHTHIFPDHQAASVLQHTARMFNVPVYGTGTASDLLSQMDSAGIDYAVIHMVAPSPSQVKETNTWLINLKQDRFIKSGTLHPFFKNNADEIKRLQDNAIHTVKLQPDIQLFYPHDRSTLYPLYESICRYNMNVMFHIGGEPLPGPNDRSTPEMISAVASDFPDMTIIGAHLGGLNMWDEVLKHLAGKTNVYFESSLSYSYISVKTAEKIIRTHGHRKIFFGTDYPFAPVNESLQKARTVAFLEADEISGILGNNACALFAPA